MDGRNPDAEGPSLPPRPGLVAYYPGDDGRRVRRSLKTENRKVARDLCLDLEIELREGKGKPPRSLPVRPLLEEYLDFKRARMAWKSYAAGPKQTHDRGSDRTGPNPTEALAAP